jgi:hypothetical protein
VRGSRRRNAMSVATFSVLGMHRPGEGFFAARSEQLTKKPSPL